MTYADAARYYDAMESRDDIVSGPGNLADKSRELMRWDDLASQEKPKPRRWTFKDVIHGVFGAGLGAGVARGASKAFGLPSSFADKLETAAMGAGAAMNTGAIKWAEDQEKADLERRERLLPKVAEQRKHAFRLGFLKAARDLGLLEDRGKLEKDAFVPVLALNPADLLSLPRSAAKALTGMGQTAGTMAGFADAPDEGDEELTRLKVKRMLLEEQLDRLRADNRNVQLRKVLAKRKR